MNTPTTAASTTNAITTSNNSNSSYLCLQDHEKAKIIVAKAGDNKFVHICLYNSLVRTSDTIEGIEALMAIYGNLLGLHGYVELLPLLLPSA
jgi:hypothetical protein